MRTVAAKQAEIKNNLRLNRRTVRAMSAKIEKNTGCKVRYKNMLKKSKGLKWTKKVWAAVISAVLGLFIAVGGAVAALAISNKSGNNNGNIADSSADKTPVTTTFSRSSSPNNSFSSHELAWKKAIEYSINHSGVATGFTLTSDWIATVNADKTNTSFGASTLNDGTEPFESGMLCVPEGANIP